MQPPWTLSASSEHNNGMQDFTDLTYTSIPQNKDSTEACIKGDSFDLEKMQTHITTCSSYTAKPILKNMVNKIVAGSDVNVHAVEAFGKTIIRDIIGNSVFAFKFTRKYRAKALWYSLAVKIASDRLSIINILLLDQT
ncbi:hypothetical protein DPMN_072350 [Dreissena polymorpha]|uniref:Uncharacterized protein n=1 Tax=Dreissena polymorpha TaxID=45954 RepID=A0A9D3Z3T3_DREPO|nr:hypothetical protein DPMN_072350 [Dreissena polymorpha]